jgi:hypothetical protein
MPFLQEVSLEVILCAYFINAMFLVGVVALGVPIYTPFNVATPITPVQMPNALNQTYTNNLKTNMTSNISNITTSNPLQILLQGNPFAFMAYVFVFLAFITGTFPFLLLNNYLVGSPAVVTFAFVVAGFMIFCLARTALFYTRGV